MITGKSLLNLFAYLMAIIYIGLGVFLLLADLSILNLSEFSRLGAGIVLVLYGLFRFYKANSDRKLNNLENDDEE